MLNQGLHADHYYQTITSCLRIKETAATSASSQRQRKREEFSLIILDPVPRGKSLRINSTSVKEQVYKASVRLLEVPMLSLGPQHQQNITRLEAVQCRSLVSQVGCRDYQDTRGHNSRQYARRCSCQASDSNLNICWQYWVNTAPSTIPTHRSLKL